MKLRSTLLRLVVGTLLPVLILTVALAYLLVDYERDAFQQAALDRNRAFMTAIDAEVNGHIATLRSIATRRSLEAGDLRAFHAEALRILETQADWRNLILLDASGRQVVNARIPWGQPLVPTIEHDSVNRVLGSRRPAIGDLVKGPRDGTWGAALRFPVVLNDRVAYILTAVITPERFAKLMADQHYPAGWAVGVMDAKGTFVARIPPRDMGQRVSPDLWNALQSSGEGWFRGRTLEGQDTFTAYRTSELSGWSVAVAVPASHINAVASRTAWGIAFGALFCLTLAAGFAVWMGRRIADPITRIAGAARRFGDEATPVRVEEHTRIQEVRDLAAALGTASTAVAEREAAREREQAALKASDKAKDEFLAMLGHELRNPLSAITAAAHLLRIARPGEDVALQAHGVIERQTRQMTRLIEDLLDVSRLSMGKVTLKRERLELGDFAARVARTWAQGKRGGTGRVRCETATAWVDGDRARLEQVIANLLENADKFSPEGTTIELVVSVSGGQALLEVADQGEGIPRELLPRIFDLFVQGPQSSDRARGGMGLGLTLVKRLAEMHGGSVDVTSAGTGHGARFSVRLPLAASGAPQAPAPATEEHRAESRRILVVEDNGDARRMLEAVLRLDGHIVHAVESGEQALEELKRWVPQVAIVDIGLPGIDGYEVARRVRADKATAQLKLVALTGYGQEADQRRAYEAGFDLHLTKPAAPEFLRDVLAVLTAKDRAAIPGDS